MTSESNGSDELAFELAEGFHEPARRPTPTSQQWVALPNLPAEGSEPATDVVELSESLMATLAKAEPQPIFVTPAIQDDARASIASELEARPTAPSAEPSSEGAFVQPPTPRVFPNLEPRSSVRPTPPVLPTSEPFSASTVRARPTPSKAMVRASEPVATSVRPTPPKAVASEPVATTVFVRPTPPKAMASTSEPVATVSVRPTPPKAVALSSERVAPASVRLTPPKAMVLASEPVATASVRPTPPKAVALRSERDASGLTPPKTTASTSEPKPEPRVSTPPASVRSTPHLRVDDALSFETDPSAPVITGPRELPMAMPAFVAERGPTTNEAMLAMQAPRPRRWLVMAGGAFLAVALFGTLLWRELRSSAPVVPASLAQGSFPAPPLVQVPEDDFAAFPVHVLPRVEEPPRRVLPEQLHEEVKPERVVAEAVPPKPAPPPVRSVAKARPAAAPSRAKAPVAEPDLLDAWQ